MTRDEFIDTMLFMRRDCNTTYDKIASSMKQLENVVWASLQFKCPIKKSRMKLIISLQDRMSALIVNARRSGELDESKSTFFIRSTEKVIDAFLEELKVR